MNHQPDELIFTEPLSVTDHQTAGAILSTLAYFSIFKHPLTADEVFLYSHYHKLKLGMVVRVLNELVEERIINHHADFYFLDDDITIVERRSAGNRLSEKYFSIAKRYSKFISGFPYVRAVFISGSLSKGYMDADSDIDYFIVTHPGRLWLCRTLLIMYKKIFLLNSKKYFCVNYFVAKDHLQIPDQNLFTATELKCVIPTYNIEIYNRFIADNIWSNYFYPNIETVSSGDLLPVRDSFLKRMAERFLNLPLGTLLDKQCLNITYNYWKKKFKSHDESYFKNELRSSSNVSRHHPNAYERKVLDKYELKLKHLNERISKCTKEKFSETA